MDNMSEIEIVNMINDTNNIIKKDKISTFAYIFQSCKQTNKLVDKVEFWKWMESNHKTWTNKQLQGKGYEWDFMSKQRSMFKNIISKFDAGNCSNHPGTDIDKLGLFDNLVKQKYQNKAYTSSNNPNLSHTPKDAIVVTNKEKVLFSRSKGYETKEFMDSNKISKAVENRIKQDKSGMYNNYNFKNISMTMTKAGLMGGIVGITTEGIASYRNWKSGAISDKEYLSEILKAGGDAGVTGGITSGIMVHISATITAAGASSIITIPIAYVVGETVNRVVAPCFSRGKYKEILNEARYYQNLEYAYRDLANSIERSAKEYEHYISIMKKQINTNNQLNARYEMIKKTNQDMDKKLKDLYDSI